MPTPPLSPKAFLSGILVLTLLFASPKHAAAKGCFKSIISFGDSLADTGNLLHLSTTSSNKPPRIGLPPYGETFFHFPTGRFCDGRLVIDFLAEHLGLPYVPPYIGGESGGHGDFSGGVNFAVGGATALDNSFFEKRGIINPGTNVSLGTQMRWFKQMLTSYCVTHSDCREFLQNSLFLVGEIGGNDYNHAFFEAKTKEEISSFVPLVVQAISFAINELIELGATTLLVPGNLPIGCSSAYLTYFKTSRENDYDPETKCLNWLNEFSEYHNQMLQEELNRVRDLHPHATIIYADYYNVAMKFYRCPDKYGFAGGALTSCCGGGGPYNYNASAACGTPASTVCDNPSLFVNWDGVHFTESTYRLIAKGLLEGRFTTPPITAICSHLRDAEI